MEVRNFLPVLLRCLERWQEPPDRARFLGEYFNLLKPSIGDVFDGISLHAALAELNWPSYRENLLLRCDPIKEEARLKGHIQAVENLFGLRLEGEAILFGSFATMDGYARFDRGIHRVFMGVDEFFAEFPSAGSKYLDILEVHELTHVVRESRHRIWEGWGLDPKMSHDDFSELQPVVEHVFGEGFSCAISELLVPSNEPWHYAYQEPDSFELILENASSVDLAVHREIKEGEQGDWSRLYNPVSYRPRLPLFTHYVWGWHWTRELLRLRAGGDARKLVKTCSRDFVDDALKFSLATAAGKRK